MAIVAFGQAGVGTITGTVEDPAGAVVAGADVVAKNTDTGIQYQSASTATGNYIIVQLPPGPYQINVMVPGFKTYTRSGVTVQVAQVLRLDIALEVGASNRAWRCRGRVAVPRGNRGRRFASQPLGDVRLGKIGRQAESSSGRGSA